LFASRTPRIIHRYFARTFASEFPATASWLTGKAVVTDKSPNETFGFLIDSSSLKSRPAG
jgi:hypothetical protein